MWSGISFNIRPRRELPFGATERCGNSVVRDYRSRGQETLTQLRRRAGSSRKSAKASDPCPLTARPTATGEKHRTSINPPPRPRVGADVSRQQEAIIDLILIAPLLPVSTALSSEVLPIDPCH